MRLLLAGLLLLPMMGCGGKKQVLRDMDNLIEESKGVDCAIIREYLNAIQVEIRKELK